MNWYHHQHLKATVSSFFWALSPVNYFLFSIILIPFNHLSQMSWLFCKRLSLDAFPHSGVFLYTLKVLK